MDDDDNDSFYRLNSKRRRSYLYGSFILCLLGGALIGAAMGTQNWYHADLTNTNDTDATGEFNAGLFQGKSVISTSVAPNTRFLYYMVCMDGECLYSCGATSQDRENHLRLILDGRLDETEPCISVKTGKARQRQSLQGTRKNLNSSPQGLWISIQDVSSGTQGQEQSARDAGAEYEDREDATITTDEPDDTTAEDNDPGDGLSSTAGLLQEGLWAGTIACLSAALLFVVLGAVFAVINTVITPVEAITGITGLYIWNSLAAAFELVAVILWSVQYSTRLVENVLILDSKGGWTTEGNESLGYSFWLVVVAMVVHIANCGLIGFGTYEPKLKEKIQEPDKVTNDILLY